MSMNTFSYYSVSHYYYNISLYTEEVQGQNLVKSGQITDYEHLFTQLGLRIGDKYMQVGTELGLQHIVLKDKLETGASVMFCASRRATDMLHYWHENAVEGFTYSRLAGALEKHGLEQCAYEYCYMH